MKGNVQENIVQEIGAVKKNYFAGVAGITTIYCNSW